MSARTRLNVLEDPRQHADRVPPVGLLFCWDFAILQHVRRDIGRPVITQDYEAADFIPKVVGNVWPRRLSMESILFVDYGVY